MGKRQIKRDLRAALIRFEVERDRRYSEVALEREKALAIKERGDRDALQLAREIQTYKDEKANELRAQIERERGSYATKDDLQKATEKVEALMAPIASFVGLQQGREKGIGLTAGVLVAVVGLSLTLIGVVVVILVNVS